MADLPHRLVDRGWRLTRQRRAVVEALAGEHVHRTADEIHRLAAERLPGVSRATVYNTLQELLGLGEIQAVHLHDGARLFDPNPVVEHHHLVCDGCGRIVDVAVAATPTPAPEAAGHGFTVDRVEIVFRGRCPDCR